MILRVYFIIATLILFIFSDALLILFPNLIQYNTSYFIKGSILFFYLVCATRLLSLQECFIIFIFIFIFSLSQAYLFHLNSITIAGLIVNIRFFVWYLFFLFLMFIHNKINKDIYNSLSIELLNKAALLIIIIICFSIFIGYVFDLSVLSSYNQRWGFKGLLPKTVTASYFFIIVLNYLYYYYVTKKKKYYFFFLVLFCSLLCGTKAIYVFNLLLLFFHIILNQKFKVKSFWIACILFFSISFVFRAQLIEKTEFLWSIFYDLYREKGFMYSLTSHRSEMLCQGLNYYNSHWNWINYLIGGRLIDVKYFEMSFFDLFYFFGGIGFFLFVYLIISYIFIPFIKKAKIHGFFFLFSVFFTSFAIGQFFVNSTVISLFFYFLITIAVNSYEQNKHT